MPRKLAPLLDRRLVVQAGRKRIPTIIVNRGETQADARAAVKIEAGTTETLAALREALRA